MSEYLQMCREDQKAVHKEMLVQAEILLKGMYPSKHQREHAARTIVDQALAKERQNEVDISGT